MKVYYLRHRFIFLSLCISFCLLLAACGQQVSAGSDNNAAQPTPTATTAATATPAATATSQPTAVFNGLGKNYAFVRNFQIWVALNGAALVQATHFDNTDELFTSATGWSNLYWFDQDRYLAFLLDPGYGRGGNYCSFYQSIGQLYVIDTMTMKTTKVSIANNRGASMTNITPEDATHLLMYQPFQGIYRYDLVNNVSALIIPSAQLASAANHYYDLYAMSAYNGQLYYETVTPHDAQDVSHFVVYSQSLSNSNNAASKVFDAGSETLCSFHHQNGPLRSLGWSISPDGAHLAVQTLDSSAQSHFSLVALQGGAATQIFEQLPASVNNQETHLAWSPNSQNILLTYYQTVYTTSLANPAASQSYQAPTLTTINWLPDSGHFTAENTTDQSVQVFSVGTSAGQPLLSNATHYSSGD